jgi:hypothetical protein
MFACAQLLATPSSLSALTNHRGGALVALADTLLWYVRLLVSCRIDMLTRLANLCSVCTACAPGSSPQPNLVPISTKNYRNSLSFDVAANHRHACTTARSCRATAGARTSRHVAGQCVCLIRQFRSVRFANTPFVGRPGAKCAARVGGGASGRRAALRAHRFASRLLRTRINTSSLFVCHSG